MKRITTMILILIAAILSLSAQESKWEFDAKIGVNIGGTSPIPLPEEIREIESYSPQFAPTIEATATRWISGRWGVSSGLRAEKRAMSTHAQVKNYRTEIIGEGGNKLRGNWTGDVHTSCDNLYLTIPVQAVYRLNKSFVFSGGLFFSYLLDGSFDGYIEKLIVLKSLLNSSFIPHASCADSLTLSDVFQCAAACTPHEKLFISSEKSYVPLFSLSNTILSPVGLSFLK